MQTLAVLAFVAFQLVLPPATRAAPPPAPAAAVATAEPALLVFKWPEGLEATVATERRKEQQTGGTVKPARSLKASYRMRVRPHAEGLIIRSEEFSGIGLNEVFVSGIGLQDAIASLVPSTVVTRNGDFVRAEDTATLKSLLKRMSDEFLAGKTDMPPQFRQMMERASSDDFFDATAAGEWSSLVGSWVQFPVGEEVFEETVEEPSPILPDMTVLLKVSRRMVERAECTRGSVRYACAVFEMRSEVDPGSMGEALGRLLKDVKDMPQIRYEHIDMVTVVRVRLETETMLPHALTVTRTLDLTMSAPGHPATPVRQVDRRSTTFTY